MHPLTAHELVDDPAQIHQLLNFGLDYSQTNGTVALRERICTLYPGSTPDNVLVTSGAAVAGFFAIWTLSLSQAMSWC